LAEECYKSCTSFSTAVIHSSVFTADASKPWHPPNIILILCTNSAYIMKIYRKCCKKCFI